MNKYDRTDRAAQNRLCKGPAKHYAALLQNRDTYDQNASTPRHQMDDKSPLHRLMCGMPRHVLDSCSRRIQSLQTGSKRQVLKDTIRGLLSV
ncbi:UNVERIFIED_CONTAM: hypothetical protein Slati_2788800 [Sesamum latifolium]|uniref:Uncharacterized protein n=1 Tax=Sesamum latifolium TaxID=2727402 RepID=A0AAW2VYC0_9LAMI